MRLTSVELSQFKAFEHATFEITPFTVVIGPNNAGKSSLLQALAVLAQSVERGQLVTSGTAIDLGGDVAELTHSSGTEDSSRDNWSIKLRWRAPVEGTDSITRDQQLDVELCVQAPSESHGLETAGSVSIPVPPQRMAQVSATYPTSSHASLEVPQVTAADRDVPRVARTEDYSASGPWIFNLALRGGGGDLEAMRRGEPDAVAHYGWAMAAPYLQRLGQAIQAFRYVGPDRFVDRSVFPLGDFPADNPRSAQQVIDTLAYNRDVLQRVSRRCDRLFDYGIDVDLMPHRQVALVAVGHNDHRHNIVNIGSGLVQFAWVILQLELAHLRQRSGGTAANSTVGIDEPELHLHPAVQPDIARVLVDYVRDGSQVICTTQSEHFLMALLQMVLEGSLTPSELSVYYVDEGRAHKLAVDEQGRLSEGLRGFFEANEEQLRERLELLMRRA